VLTAFGLVMVYSASMVTAVVEGLESTYYLKRQAMWFGLGFVGFIFTSIFPYRLYQKYMKIIILFVLLSLAGVLFFGVEVNNAKSWLSLGGPFRFQPAEFAKIGLILYLASVYSKKQSYLSSFGAGVLPPLIMTAIILGFIVIQPDIGTTAIIFLIA